MKKTLYLMCLCTSFLFAGCSSSEELNENIIEFTHRGILHRVEVYSGQMARILSHPANDTLVTRRLIRSLQLPEEIQHETTESDSSITVSTSVLRICFDKANGTFAFYEQASGKLLTQEKVQDMDATFRPSEAGGESCYRITHYFDVRQEESFYGLGQYQNGVFNYRKDSVLLLQSNTDIVNPFMVSTNGYGILWDNYSSSIYRNDGNSFCFESEVGDAVDYYFIYGSDMAGVTAGYRTLTGEVPMFPKSVFGFWQSKERYKSFEELENVVKEYRRREIPLDYIVQDWEYWGPKERWNALEFDSLTFDKPEEVLSRLHTDHQVNFMLSVWPGFGAKTAIYRELDSIGALFDEPTWANYKVFDVYNPQARAILWKYISRLQAMGVDAWWLDATEPSFREGFTQLKQEEKTKSAGTTHWGAFHRYLNTYSLVLTQFLYNNLREADPQKRPFILTRSAFAGQQKYGTAVWSGDVVASWENFRKQIPAGLNLSVSGIPYWCSDIGGFFVTERGAQFPEGLNDERYKELYIRWFQFGALCPLFRAHGTNIPREIWALGDEDSDYYQIQKKFIALRYWLLPYLYTCARNVSVQNEVMMRPLVMDFTADTMTHELSESYLLGRSLLVRPVTEPASGKNACGAVSVSTYLPKCEGNIWYDFESGAPYMGGSRIHQKVSLAQMPLFVKCGSILPLTQPQTHVSKDLFDTLDIRVYSGANASFLYYDDLGDGFDYEKGKCIEIPFEWNEEEKLLRIGSCETAFSELPKIALQLTIYMPERSEPILNELLYTGEEIEISFK